MANEKQRKTFLSYSRVNKDFAVRLAKELKSEGFLVWLDQLDIPLGARWDVEVEKALEECEVFMIIMTPAAIASENVRDEIGYAIDNNKRFLPVLLESCTVPLRLRRFQYIDFTNKSFDDGVEGAKELLRSLIAQPTVPRLELSEETQKKLAQAKEEADRLAAQKAEEERLAKQKVEEEKAARAKAEAEQKAREETDRLAAQKVEEEKAANTKAEANRLAANKAEEERLAKQKAEADRKSKEDHEAKAEADRLATQKAEKERLARVEAERKTKEEADRLAAQKAEQERLARVEAERKVKEEADRLAAKKAEEAKAAKAKADREAKTEADRKAREEAKNQALPVPMETAATPVQNKPVSKGLVIGVVAVVVLVIAAIGVFALIGMNALKDSPAATQAAVKEPTSIPPTTVKQPTSIPPTAKPASTATLRPTSTPVPTVAKFFTEEFNSSAALNPWDTFTVTGDSSSDPSKVTVQVNNGNLEWNFNSTNVYYYLFYNATTYTDVQLEMSANNLAKFTNDVSLVCRYKPNVGWYEFNVGNDGLYSILYSEILSNGNINYNTLKNGGSNAILSGNHINKYKIICKGQELTLFINDTEVISFTETKYNLQEGELGISVSSYDVLPILLDVDWVKISQP